MLKAYILNATKVHGGCTVDYNCCAPTAGYMVGVRGFETLEAMLDYPLGVNEYYGTWVDEGKVYYDISINVQNLAVAVGLAKCRHELAIYDIANGVAIDTK